jgi:P4 family phage/plasmid primase-like protien
MSRQPTLTIARTDSNREVDVHTLSKVTRPARIKSVSSVEHDGGRRSNLIVQADLAHVPFLAPGLPTSDARDGTKTTRPLTEYGNAQRLFDLYGDRLRFVHETRTWIVWTGDAWQRDYDGADVRTLAAGLASTIYDEGASHLKDAECFARHARKSQEKKTVSATVSMLSDFPLARISASELDQNPLTVGFAQSTKVIDLKSGLARAAAPSDYITKSLGVSEVGECIKALRWLQFLDEVFSGDAELIDWIQRFCGYLLTGSTEEQFFLFCFGHGANGKSVFFEALKHILADYGRAIAPETVAESKRSASGASPELAALIGARMAICGETEDNSAIAESLMKSLVSGDSMVARNLHCGPVQFTPIFKLLMAGNHKPVIKGTDHGMWRRIRIIPFNHVFTAEERDPKLLAKLKDEAPHILAWMVEGCVAWQRQGLADIPAAVRRATDSYRVDQDVVGAWLLECTEEAPGQEVLSGELYANYRAWATDNGLRPVSSSTFGRQLGERNFNQRQSNGKRYWGRLILTDSRHISPRPSLEPVGLASSMDTQLANSADSADKHLN